LNEVHFGGNLGLGLAKFLHLSISQVPFYQATEQLGLGAGLNFNYAQNFKMGKNSGPTVEV